MKPGDITTIRIDNRYRNGKIVRKQGQLVGNKETVQIVEVPNPANPLQPILMVGDSLAKHLSQLPKEGRSK